MIPLIKEKQEKIAELCRQFGIRRLEVFGSAATGAFDPEKSDIDFIVDLGEYERGVARRYFRFAEAMEALLGREVDVITEAQITNPYFHESVNASRTTIYECRNHEAVA